MRLWKVLGETRSKSVSYTHLLAQVGAVPGEDCVVPVGQAADEAVGVGQLGRGDALLVGGVQAAVG